jgi:hypothetical protein
MTFQLSAKQKDVLQSTLLIRDSTQSKQLFAAVETLVNAEVAGPEELLNQLDAKLRANEEELAELRRYLAQIQQRKWDDYHKEFCRLGLLCNHKPPTENTEKKENR